MKRLAFSVLMLVGVVAVVAQISRSPPSISQQNSKDAIVISKQSIEDAQTTESANTTIADAFTNGESNVQIYGEGVVIKLLSDDNEGDRHQRFIVKLSSNQTLLIAHNIDLAPRINSLQQGDFIKFYGEYEWNDKGGVIHWTHRDPDGSHEAGWLEHQGKRYQ